MDPSPDELRFGIMCDGLVFSDWMVRCIERLRELDDVNLELLILDDRPSPVKSGTSTLSEKLSKLYEYKKKTSSRDALDFATWRYYQKVTGARKAPETALDSRDLSGELAGVDRIRCVVEEDGFSEYFSAEDIERIEAYDLDFLLRGGFGIIRGDILDAPTYGVWSFHHDDERKYRGGPACLWEILKGDPVTGAILQRLTETLDSGIVLRRGHFRTQPTWSKNVNHVYYGTADWPAQVAIDILHGNAEYLTAPPTESDAPIYRNPSGGQLAKYHLRELESMIDTVTTGRYTWNIGVIRSTPDDLLDESRESTVRWFPDPVSDGFLADPFPINIGGETYMFFEEYDETTERGRISYTTYPEGFKEGVVETAHREPFHMSYPFPVETAEGVYVVPETHEANEIRLYRLQAPDDWEKVATLVSDMQGVDPTILEYDGRFWLFFTRAEEIYPGESYPQSKLYVYHADELTGEWEPHENNPVKTDVRSARPAGTPFVTSDGSVLRPAQYCAEGYGQKVIVNEVVELSRSTFSEKRFAEIYPTQHYPSGTHTLSADDRLIVIDGKRQLWDTEVLKKRANQMASKIRMN